MHILVVNDDGPPSNQSSPYVHSLISTLQAHSHTVSVVLPHTQRSWIGKAHFVAQTAKPSYFRPGTLHNDDGAVHAHPLGANDEGEEWVLIDGTPATCTQLGLHHFFQSRGPVDLVISGPNYGRNSTALFSLSSGTIGGAMEGAVCGKKAIALSYAFYSRDHDPEVIAGASRLSVKLIEYLMKNWGNDVDLYSINVPLVKGVEDNKVMITSCLVNTWRSGSSFKEVEAGDIDPEEREREIREQEPAQEGTSISRHKHRHFKWAPNFADVHKSVEESGPGHDGWTINQGMTSVTPMKAKFAEAQAHPLGELKLSSALSFNTPKFQAYVAYEDAYVNPLILAALSKLPSKTYELLSSPLLGKQLTPKQLYLQITPYENISHESLLSHPTYIANAYTIRKALIRKHYLANTVASWLPKHPDSPLKQHVPLTIPFELDYAEFLDDALLEAWELHSSWAHNSTKPPSAREWWILKPSMSDRGQGIRLFSTEAELASIFEEWEAENPEDDSGADSSPSSPEPPDPETQNLEPESAGLITSQLRHFIAQPYIPPLLLPSLGDRKFHIRSYVLCVGALAVYVYKDMLALFAEEPYIPPGQSSSTLSQSSEELFVIDLRRHLTNTCLQSPLPSDPAGNTLSGNDNDSGSIHRYWSLPPISLPSDTLPNTLGQAFTTICETTAELFRAAAAQPTSFQPLPNAFEVFGVDWMLDEEGKPWLLEVNAFPDFAQSGEGCRGVVEGFWEEVLGVVGGRVLGVEGVEKGKGEREMVKVLELDMGRR